MIAHVAKDIRDAVDDVALSKIVATPLYDSTTCMVCGQSLPAGETGTVNAVVLRDPAEQTAVRYAHPGCSDSKLVDVAALPAATADTIRTDTPVLDVPTAPAPAVPRGVAWALVGRKGRLPNIALIWDLEASPTFGQTPQSTLRFLQDNGMRNVARPVLQLEPKIIDGFDLAREDYTLLLRTPAGEERLDIDDPESSLPMLEIAAAQRRLLIVAGIDLRLDHNDLALTDRQLQFAESACAQVRYEDLELRPAPSRKRRALTRLAFGRNASRSL